MRPTLYESPALADAAEDTLATLLEEHRDLISDTYDRPEAADVKTFAAATGGPDGTGVIIYLEDGSEIHFAITAYAPQDETI